jgi:hypothetical protein
MGETRQPDKWVLKPASPVIRHDLPGMFDYFRFDSDAIAGNVRNLHWL